MPEFVFTKMNSRVNVAYCFTEYMPELLVTLFLLCSISELMVNHCRTKHYFRTGDCSLFFFTYYFSTCGDLLLTKYYFRTGGDWLFT